MMKYDRIKFQQSAKFRFKVKSQISVRAISNLPLSAFRDPLTEVRVLVQSL